MLANGSEEEIKQSLEEYQRSRKGVTSLVIQNESGKWNEALDNKSSNELWGCIDWKGRYNNNKLKIHPTINELKHTLMIYTELRTC